MADIVIRGMGMPTNCSGCKLAQHQLFSRSIRCPILGYSVAYYDEGIHYEEHDCPLIEIPTPHGRLIDADRLISENAMIKYDWSEAVDVEDIKNAPTIIEAERGDEDSK